MRIFSLDNMSVANAWMHTFTQREGNASYTCTHEHAHTHVHPPSLPARRQGGGSQRALTEAEMQRERRQWRAWRRHECGAVVPESHPTAPCSGCFPWTAVRQTMQDDLLRCLRSDQRKRFKDIRARVCMRLFVCVFVCVRKRCQR